jgi:ATP-dependent RNA helicase DOB1
MHIKDPDFEKVTEQIEKFESRLFAHPLHEKDDIDDLYAQYLEKDKV